MESSELKMAYFVDTRYLIGNREEMLFVTDLAIYDGQNVKN